MVGFLLAVVSAFVVSSLLARYLVSHDGWFRILDHPNRRSLHSVPMPRTGGLAIFAGCVAGATVILIVLGVKSDLVSIGGVALVVGLISVSDDRFHVSVWVRLAIHLLSGGLLVVCGFVISAMSVPGLALFLPAGAVSVLTVLFVVWMINLYNFMDGMDGFAGGMAVFGFGTLGLIGYMGDDAHFAALCWVIAAAAGGFLVWNFPPARIFMGDSGSSVLGVMAAAMSLWGDRLGLFPLWIATLVFSPFTVDATVTLIRRAVRGERLWVAHRSHYYQRLVKLGWGHKKTVLVEYLLMAGCGISAIVLVAASPIVQWLGLGVWGIIYVTGIYAVTRLEASSS